MISISNSRSSSTSISVVSSSKISSFSGSRSSCSNSSCSSSVNAWKESLYFLHKSYCWLPSHFADVSRESLCSSLNESSTTCELQSPSVCPGLTHTTSPDWFTLCIDVIYNSQQAISTSWVTLTVRPIVSAAHALPMFREARQRSTRKQLEKDRLDPKRSHKPEPPVSGPGRVLVAFIPPPLPGSSCCFLLVHSSESHALVSLSCTRYLQNRGRMWL